jgi:hypothetical protein
MANTISSKATPEGITPEVWAAYLSQMQMVHEQRSDERVRRAVEQMLERTRAKLPLFDVSGGKASPLFGNAAAGLGCGSMATVAGAAAALGYTGTNALSQPVMGPQIDLPPGSGNYYKYVTRSVPQNGQLSINIAFAPNSPLGPPNFVGQYQGVTQFQSSGFEVAYSTTHAGLYQVFNSPDSYAQIRAGVRLIAPNVSGNGVQNGIYPHLIVSAPPGEQLASAWILGQLTVSVLNNYTGRVLGSASVSFLEVGTHNVGSSPGISLLDTAETLAPYPNLSVTPGPGFADAVVTPPLTSPLAGRFVVDVDVAVTCGYYYEPPIGSNINLGAWLDLRDPTDLAVTTIPEFAQPNVTGLTTIGANSGPLIVSQIVLCGDPLSTGSPPTDG